MAEPDEAHYARVRKAFFEWNVTPFLGSGVNLAERTSEDWHEGCGYLPSGAELADHLAQSCAFPDADRRELLRVAQFCQATLGEGPLYRELRKLFDGEYGPNLVHRFLARLPAALRREGQDQQLIITTNYDDALEQAFRDQNEEYDLVWYQARGDHRGSLLHLPPGGDPRVIEAPNEYALPLERRPVIFKIHGAIDRGSAAGDSYVISEDHYIDYMTHDVAAAEIPAVLMARMNESHFLFLGYSLRDWNLRVLFQRVWGARELSYQSWAVDMKEDPIEEALWNSRGRVMMVHAPLAAYIGKLQEGMP
jgi:hypothetical protein